MKRLFTIFALLFTLLGTTQMSVAAALPMEHMLSDMHSMVEMDSEMAAVDCADMPGCELQSSCGGHLCSAISSVAALDFVLSSFRKPEYQATFKSLYIISKDRPPQFQMS